MPLPACRRHRQHRVEGQQAGDNPLVVIGDPDQGVGDDRGGLAGDLAHQPTLLPQADTASFKPAQSQVSLAGLVDVDVEGLGVQPGCGDHRGEVTGGGHGYLVAGVAQPAAQGEHRPDVTAGAIADQADPHADSLPRTATEQEPEAGSGGCVGFGTVSGGEPDATSGTRQANASGSGY